jgi:hypothetical protein
MCKNLLHSHNNSGSKEKDMVMQREEVEKEFIFAHSSELSMENLTTMHSLLIYSGCIITWYPLLEIRLLYLFFGQTASY